MEGLLCGELKVIWDVLGCEMIYLIRVDSYIYFSTRMFRALLRLSQQPFASRKPSTAETAKVILKKISGIDQQVSPQQLRTT